MDGRYKHLDRNRAKGIRNLMVFMVLALIFFSCAHRELKLQESTSSAVNNSQVNIIREHLFFGFGIPLTVAFDNKAVCRLQAGEYVVFEVEAGVHTLGLSESTIKVPFVAKGKYYFLIKTYPDENFGFEIERIDDKMGRYLIAISKIVK